MLCFKFNFINNMYNNGILLKVIYLMILFVLYFGVEVFGVFGIIVVVFVGLVYNVEGEWSVLVNF